MMCAECLSDKASLEKYMGSSYGYEVYMAICMLAGDSLCGWHAALRVARVKPRLDTQP